MHLLFEDTGASLGDGIGALDLHTALVDDDHAVPEAWDHVFIGCTTIYCDVNEVSGSSGSDGTLNAKDFACNDFCEDFVVFVFWNLCSFEFLILRLAILVSSVKVQPQLESICWDIKARWHFCMNNSFSCCHPLEIARTEFTGVPLEIFVHDFSRQHVSDCLHSSMRVIWESRRQLNIEVVQHQKWIEVGQLTDSDKPFYSGTNTLSLLFCNESLCNCF